MTFAGVRTVGIHSQNVHTFKFICILFLRDFNIRYDNVVNMATCVLLVCTFRTYTISKGSQRLE